MAAGSASAAGPLTWGSEEVIDPGQTIESIDCPAVTLCVASDTTGNILASADPATASSWTLDPVNPGVNIENVSCPSTALCLAVDYDGNVWWSTDPAAAAPTWTSASIAGAGVNIQSLDCPSAVLCLAGGKSNGTIYWSTDPTGGAAQWHSLVVDAGREIASLSCPTVTFCIFGEDSLAAPPGVAVFWTTNPTTALATDWTKIDNFDVDPVNSGSVMEGLSCPTPSFCVGSDDFGNVLPSTNPSGATSDWAAPHLANFPVYWNISCPATTLCVTESGATTYTSTNPTGGAAAWATDQLAGTSLDAVSCATAGFCAVAGRNVASSNGVAYIGRQAALAVTVAGSGTGSVTGNGIACPGTCSLFYPLNTPVSLTATPGTDGSTFAGWSGACTGTGTCDLTMSADRALTATFDPAPPPATVASNPPPDNTPTPAPAPDQLPPPVQSQTANVFPQSGTVLVKPVGSTKFVPLSRPLHIPFGAVFDTRAGAVQIVISNGHGGTSAATFSEGLFRLVAAGNVAELDLFGGNFKGCPKAAQGGASAAAVKRGKLVRHLWGNGGGAFRSKGRYASATIRGTHWLTADYCQGTLVKVAAGAVTVRDLVKKQSVALRAPKTYFAPAKG